MINSRKYKGLIICLLALLVSGVVFAAYYLFFVEAKDTEAPVIHVPDGQIEVSVSDGDEKLLEGVTASDNKDGDVTAGMVVESVSNITDDDIVTVKIAAFDTAGNVTKAERQVHYTDYRGPRFTLSVPLLFREGTRFDIMSCIGVDDLIDTHLDDRIKATLLSESYSVDVAGEYLIQFRVTNSLGDNAIVELPAEVYSVDTYNAQLELTDYLIYLKKGDAFDPESYLDNFKTGVTNFALVSPLARSQCEITVRSGVNTDEAGTYEVNYTVTKDNYTAGSRLMVIVEE